MIITNDEAELRELPSCADTRHKRGKLLSVSDAHSDRHSSNHDLDPSQPADWAGTGANAAAAAVEIAAIVAVATAVAVFALAAGTEAGSAAVAVVAAADSAATPDAEDAARLNRRDSHLQRWDLTRLGPSLVHGPSHSRHRHSRSQQRPRGTAQQTNEARRRSNGAGSHSRIQFLARFARHWETGTKGPAASPNVLSSPWLPT